MESIEKILANLGAADIDSKLEEALIDGILYAFQEQTTEVSFQFVLVHNNNRHYSLTAGSVPARVCTSNFVSHVDKVFDVCNYRDIYLLGKCTSTIIVIFNLLERQNAAASNIVPYVFIQTTKINFKKMR